MTKKAILALFFTLLLVGCNSSAKPTSSTSIILSNDIKQELQKPENDFTNTSPLSTAYKAPIVRTFKHTGDVARQIPVLTYHHLLKKKENTFRNNGVVLNVENFQEQMDYLYNNKFTTINVEELEQWLLRKIELPKKSVCITFDDGYLSSYIYAYPILKKYDFKAVQFLITSCVKHNDAKFISQKKQFLSWQNIIDSTDVFEYSNHTDNLHQIQNHKGYLITKPLDFVKKDLIKNIKLTNSPYFCYPYGHYNDDILKLLKELGIRMAFTVHKGSVKRGDSLLELKRYGIYPVTSIKKFKKIVNGDL
jgi:peptidoglycan/xylan/chitin deacetylase (PgdA/CDA1 family)